MNSSARGKRRFRTRKRFGQDRDPRHNSYMLLKAILIFSVASVALAQTSNLALQQIANTLRAGDPQKALELIAYEKRKDPHDPRLFLYEGLARIGSKDVEGARRAYRTAMRLDANYVPAIEAAAQLEYQAQSPEATSLLKHLLELKPGDPTARAMLGHLAFVHKDCGSAVQYYDLRNPLVATQTGALEEYGTCLLREKRPEAAVAVFETVVQQHPDDGRARLQLAAVDLMVRDPLQAVRALQPLLNRGSESPEASLLAAEAYEASGDTPAAVNTLREAILRSPRRLDLYTEFADISFAHRSFQVGIDMLNAGLSELPDSPELLIARGVLYVQLADYGKAEADFDRAGTLDPNSAMSAEVKSMSDMQRDDLDNALAKVRAELKKKPNSPRLHCIKAEILSQQGAGPGALEFTEAERAAEEATRLDPSLASARDILGKLYLSEGRYRQAAEQSRLALKNSPDDDTAIYHLIQALRKTPGDHTQELASLVKQLAVAREQKRREEAEVNRYKLVEGTPAH